MKSTKLTALFLAMILLVCSVFSPAAYAKEIPDDEIIPTGSLGDLEDFEIIPVETVEGTYPERPADAKVVDIIDILVDENGNMDVSQSASASIMSYYSPSAITLSASGNWYFGAYRKFDGHYLGWEVSAKYSNGKTSSSNGLYICLSGDVPAGDLNRQIYAIPLDGKTHKPEDWRRKLGTSNFRFKYYNSTYGTSKAGTIRIKVTVYSWD